MKRIFVLLLVALLALPLASCGPNYKTRTAEFYGNIDYTSFWYTGEVTKDKTVYTYTQAVDADSCTTIEDHKNNSEDGYVIYDGVHLHSLDFSARKYNTLKTDKGTKFIFADANYKDYNDAKIITDAAIFDGETLYCEIFSVVDENGDEMGENKYYFKDDRLVAIEWVEEEKTTAILRIKDYSTQIPDDIYVSLPEGFRAGTYTTEQIVDPWGDLSE